MIESEWRLFQKTKVGGPYEYTPKQLLNLTQPPKKPIGAPKSQKQPEITGTKKQKKNTRNYRPQKAKNDPKIRLTLKVRIQGSIENKSLSAI